MSEWVIGFDSSERVESRWLVIAVEENSEILGCSGDSSGGLSRKTFTNKPQRTKEVAYRLPSRLEEVLLGRLYG